MMTVAAKILNEGNARWAFVALVVVQAVIYGANNVVMKAAYADIAPMWCAVLRFGIALAVFMAFFGRTVVADLRRVSPRAWLPSALCMAGAFLTSSLAVDLTSATNAGFFIALPMLFTPLLALVMLGRAYRLSTIALQALVLVGLYLLCCNGGSLSFGAGEVVGLASSVFFAAALVFGERGLGDVSAATLSVVQIGATFLAAVPLAAAFEPAPDVAAVSGMSWAAVAFLALAGTCLAFLLQNTALSRVPSATVSVILCAEPVITAVLSGIVLGEALSGVGIVGAVVIVACTVAATLLDSREPEGAEGDDMPAGSELQRA